MLRPHGVEKEQKAFECKEHTHRVAATPFSHSGIQWHLSVRRVMWRKCGQVVTGRTRGEKFHRKPVKMIGRKGHSFMKCHFVRLQFCEAVKNLCVVYCVCPEAWVPGPFISQRRRQSRFSRSKFGRPVLQYYNYWADEERFTRAMLEDVAVSCPCGGEDAKNHSLRPVTKFHQLLVANQANSHVLVSKLRSEQKLIKQRNLQKVLTLNFVWNSQMSSVVFSCENPLFSERC